MNAKAIQKAFANKTPITLDKNVQKIREKIFKLPLFAQCAKFAGKPLRIWHVDLQAAHQFVRVGSLKNNKGPKVEYDKSTGYKVAIFELMIPIQAVKALPKPKKFRGKKK